MARLRVTPRRRDVSVVTLEEVEAMVGKVKKSRTKEPTEKQIKKLRKKIRELEEQVSKFDHDADGHVGGSVPKGHTDIAPKKRKKRK